ncbi:MAG: alpha/beta fold hydrolase [Ruminiclostridium sp.]|nr:alpha/beta fold hydrolase [Ruminiclostridium sp.]
MRTQPIVIGKGSKYPLRGLLTFPDHAPRPVPAVVLVHGSGSSNMDEKVGKLTPFKDLAEGLAAQGIASVRYNKRSHSHGLKMLRDRKTVITVEEETIQDAILATNLLREHSWVDPEKIFLIGHSMGGMLAPRIDAEGGNYRGLVLMAGTPRKLEEVMVEQIDEAINEMNPLLQRLAVLRMSKTICQFDGLYDLTDEEAKKKKFGGGTTLYYFKEMGEHPVADYLVPLEKPVLIMQGEKDFQVKAEKDFAMYQELLKGKENVTYKLYEGLNHAFVPSVYGKISKAKKEYNVEQHIGDEVISDIANWIMAAAKV